MSPFLVALVRVKPSYNFKQGVQGLILAQGDRAELVNHQWRSTKRTQNNGWEIGHKGAAAIEAHKFLWAGSYKLTWHYVHLPPKKKLFFF